MLGDVACNQDAVFGRWTVRSLPPVEQARRHQREEAVMPVAVRGSGADREVVA
jgi:hypothetical protein